jgi:hypothetical protein
MARACHSKPPTAGRERSPCRTRPP